MPAASPGWARPAASGGHNQTILLWNPVDHILVHVIPLGMPVHALVRHPTTLPGRGGALTVGTRDGVLAIDIHESLFPAQP